MRGAATPSRTTGIRGLRATWISRVPGDLGGHTVDYIGWDALIRNKRASDREKDRLDVKTLLSIASKKRKT